MYRRHCRVTILIAFCAALLVLGFSWPTSGQESTERVEAVRNPQESLAYDAAWYAEDQSIALEEAIRRLTLAKAIGRFAAILAEKEKDSFAGSWLTHAPEFRAHIAFTQNGEELLDSYLKDSSLRAVITLESATFTYEALRGEQVELAEHIIDDLEIDATVGINQQANRIEVKVLNVAPLRAIMMAEEPRIEDMVTFVEVEELPKPELNDYAGLRQTGKGDGTVPKGTSGFIVYKGTKPSLKFHTTAGHIEGTVWVYGGTPNRRRLPFYREYWGGPYDFQLHRIPSTITPKAWAVDNVGNDGTPYYREVTNMQYSFGMEVNDLVCHYGSNTGYSCGYITQTDMCMEVDEEYGCPYVEVINAKHGGGDSGGPWYQGSVAFGTHVGGGGAYSVFMPFEAYVLNGYNVYTIYNE
jgi:hypothetical protein